MMLILKVNCSKSFMVICLILSSIKACVHLPTGISGTVGIVSEGWSLVASGVDGPLTIVCAK